MRIAFARDRPDPRGRVGGISATGERTGQLGLRGADDESEYGVKSGQPIVVG